MKLYMVPLAPNPTKVMLYIAERAALGVEMGIEQVIVNTLKGRHREPAHLARNPFGTLPVLELADGSFLLESLAIMEYLEDKFPVGRIMGETPEERAHKRDIERIVDIRLAGPMGIYGHATNSPIGYPADPETAEQALSAMQQPLDFLETLVSDGRVFLCGPNVSPADCTLQASLQFMRFISVDVLGAHPMLKAWDARYRAHPPALSVLQW